MVAGSTARSAISFTLTAATNRGSMLEDARSTFGSGLSTQSAPRYFRYTQVREGGGCSYCSDCPCYSQIHAED